MTATIDRHAYSELLGDALPHVIRTEEDNEAALAVISDLMAKGEDLSLEGKLLLELMTYLVERFEAETYPIANASPVEVLRELLESNGLRQRDLVPDVGSRGVVSEILSGKSDISKKQARILSERFHVSPAVFLT